MAQTNNNYTAMDLKTYLEMIQQNSTQTKILNAILALSESVDEIGNSLRKTQVVVNELVDKYNQLYPELAEALNNDIEEDVTESTPVDESTVAAED